MIETYPEMNETIKEILKMNSESSVHQYAYKRIIELESKLERYENALIFGVNYLKNSDSRQIQLVRNALKEALEV